ncbi:MAG: hypothetical protein H0U52_00460 [Chloroflexi bacterium]|nr:hypothetical protein [Chloroflexota bacterium]
MASTLHHDAARGRADECSPDRARRHRRPQRDGVRALQAAGEGITGDIPTNLFLFFNVQD